MKFFGTILFFVVFLSQAMLRAQVYYQTSMSEIAFFSSAPIEDIHAVSKDGLSVLDIQNNEISFRVDIKSFQFRKSRMQEHFNENFMESDKYPAAGFKGKIREQIDLSRNGRYAVTLLGVLDIKGKQREREIPCTLVVEDDVIHLNSSFDVACRDHSIEIPRILWRNIAEVVEVTVKATYTRI